MLNLHPLSRLLTQLAVDAVNTQRHLDEAYAYDSFVRSPFDAELPPGVLEAVVPNRLSVGRFEMELGVVLGETRARGYHVGARAINAGFEMRYGSGVERQSRIRIHVDQVPSETSDGRVLPLQRGT